MQYTAIYNTIHPYTEFVIKSKSIKGLMQQATRLNILAVVDILKIFEDKKYITEYRRTSKKAPNNTFYYGKWN